MSEHDDLNELITKQSEQEAAKPEQANDRIPDKSIPDVNIPDEELSERCMEEWKNDIQDKDSGGWKEKRIYDDHAYYEIVDSFFSNHPWPNAYNKPVCMTQVLVDTMWSMVDDLYWRNAGKKIVTVSPTSEEDIKKSRNVETILNWQGINNIQDFQQEDSASNFYAIQKGTGFIKFLDVGERGQFKLGAFNIKPEYIYMPTDSTGTAIGKSSGVTQLIPLNANDMRARLGMGVYRNLDKVGKGYLPTDLSAEEMQEIQKAVTGLDVIQKSKRDTW